MRARRRARTVDGNMHSAVEAVVAGFSANHSDEHFPAVRDPSEQWHLLVGVHATFERHNDDHTQYFTGVVLGADWDPLGPRLRLVLTCQTLARQAGDTVTVAACRWLTDPTPASIAAAASRHTHCPAGRPLYDPADVPGAVLATKADLALQRQQPATLQPPVASLRRTNGVTELYAIVDAEEIPTLPRNQPAITRRRTCTQCGVASARPFPKADDGKHYCPLHVETASRRAADAVAARNRAVSAVWAREVQSDPDTVLVAMLGAPTDFRIRVEDVAGAELLDRSVEATPIPPVYRQRTEETPPVDLPSWVHGEHVRALAHRRALVVGTARGIDYYERMHQNEIARGTIPIREDDGSCVVPVGRST